jgi:cation:H+ antiporter
MLSVAEILIGLFLLYWGADRLVIGAGATARNLGVSPVLIGLVIVGFATSAPEMLISAVAAMDGAPALAVGNALGSNIANLGMVLGAAVLLTPLAVLSQTLRQEFPAVLAATGLAYLLFLDNELSRVDALILLSALLLLTVWLVFLGMRSSVFDPLRIEYGDEFSDDLGAGRATLWLVVGLVTLLVGSELMVNGAIDAARQLGISELVLGVTIVAIGTSLPELAVAVAGALKRECELVLGNVLGSNIFNLLAVIGIAGAIQPHELTNGVLSLHYPLMAVMTLAVFALAYNRRARVQLTRPVGAMLLLTFLGYQGYVIWNAMA